MEHCFEKDNMHILIRIEHPTRFSFEPYSTQWHVIGQETYPIIYVQTSTDQFNPKWERFGSMLERIYMYAVEDHTFMEDCLNKFLSK